MFFDGVCFMKECKVFLEDFIFRTKEKILALKKNEKELFFKNEILQKKVLDVELFFLKLKNELISKKSQLDENKEEELLAVMLIDELLILFSVWEKKVCCLQEGVLEENNISCRVDYFRSEICQK